MFILRLIIASLIFAEISVVWATSDSDVNDQNDEVNHDDEYTDEYAQYDDDDEFTDENGEYTEDDDGENGDDDDDDNDDEEDDNEEDDGEENDDDEDDEYTYNYDKRSDDRYVEYTGKSLVRFIPQTSAHLSVLKNMENSNKFIELFFWDSPDALNKHVHVAVPYQKVQQLYKLSKKHGLNMDVVHRDFKGVLKREESGINNKDLRAELFNLNQFNTHNSTNTWLDHVAKRCAPDCEIVHFGKSYEKRNLKMIKIGKAPKGIFIGAGFHAREWSAITSALHLINRLTNKKDELGQYLLSKYTFHIIPIINPDGYEFSRIATRNWSKTRTIRYSRSCPGVDPNKNFPIGFGGEGSVSDVCKDTYQGPSPLSEPETQSVANYINAQKSNLVGYLMVHNYGKLILYPWACNKSLTYDSKDLKQVAVSMKSEIKKNANVDYVEGPIANVLYVASGGNTDWVKAVPQVKFTYDMLVSDGFVYPAEEIEPISKQFIDGIKGMVNGISEFYSKG